MPKQRVAMDRNSYTKARTTMVDQGDQLISIKELAEWLGVKTEWVYDSVQAKRLPHYRLGRQIRFKRSEIQAYLDSTSVEPV